jgi:UDP-4-amino-4-deoxy-L-arabinose formyltransferase/UDP-glucuronic acid dehydrogenase (UDP-4-keto-hexauronic acid decarboxylating)
VKKLKVVLVGEESAGIQALKLLGRKGHEVVGVITSAATASPTQGASVHDVATKLGYRIWPTCSVKDAAFADTIRVEATDILLNVHSLNIIHERVLTAPTIGCFNLHPGPLPRYAGLNAVSWAIYRGETQHGVTIHRMSALVDAGTIAYQELFTIGDSDTGLMVSSKCTRLGLALIEKLLAAAATDAASIPARQQHSEHREYFGREIPNDGVIDWNVSARQVHNFVRAADFAPFRSPWGVPRARLGERLVGVLRTELTGRWAGVAPELHAVPTATELLSLVPTNG